MDEGRMRNMDARNKDKHGQTICPMCKKHYWPELGERYDHDMAVHKQFPHAKAYQREQLITGLCSDKCWDEYFDKCWDEYLKTPEAAKDYNHAFCLGKVDLETDAFLFRNLIKRLGNMDEVQGHDE